MQQPFFVLHLMTKIDSVCEMMCLTNFTMMESVPNIGNFIL